jgi:hypothetical protein
MRLAMVRRLVPSPVFWAALLCAAPLILPAPAAAQPLRCEAPIVQSTLSNGARRYAVPVQVGGKAILASLDTGSTGLRILPGVLAPGDAAPSDDPETYGYASGSRYEGVASEAALVIGAAKGRAPVHLIRTIGCFAYLPHCPASRTTLDKYGIASDGLPGEGFKAILGIDMAPGKVGNPLRALGARRWIVELPRPGEGDGRLILNPTDAEAAGFVAVPLAAPYAHEPGGGLHDAVPGCLANAQTHARACGVVLMDTGAPGLAIVNGPADAGPWPDGAKAELELFDTTGGLAVRAAFTTGQRDLGTRLSWRRERRVAGVVIYAGIAPYFAYSVLYDPRRQTIGLKPRPQALEAARALDVEAGR